MIEVNGIDRIICRFEEIADIGKMKNAVGKAAALVEGTAREKAKEQNIKGRTGDLIRSIESRVETSGTDITGIVSVPLEYAPYIEYGTGLFAETQGRTDVPWSYKDDEGNWHSTSGQPPRPFLRPALNENRNEVVRILERGAKDG